ncbi:MAG: ATP-dependent dethiobiotin synthetase BioD [Thermoleophilia bacterium]|nr:ATP-dependent dethiobiotin synthetase BioD [Thermoleophilia bacterium]
MKALIVAGTDTGVGKTMVTAAFASQAQRAGRRVAVLKPAQTGLPEGESGDVDEVKRLSGVEDIHEIVRHPEPLAPATAAAQVGDPGITVEQIVDVIDEIKDRDLIIIEGAGGVLVRFDELGGTLIDLAVALEAPVVLVARAGLGTLNHSALSIEALRNRGAECPGVVIGAWPEAPDLVARANVSDLPSYCGAPLLGRIPDGAARLDPLEFQTQAQSWINSGGLL